MEEDPSELVIPQNGLLLEQKLVELFNEFLALKRVVDDFDLEADEEAPLGESPVHEDLRKMDTHLRTVFGQIRDARALAATFHSGSADTLSVPERVLEMLDEDTDPVAFVQECHRHYPHAQRPLAGRMQAALLLQDGILARVEAHDVGLVATFREVRPRLDL